MPLTVVLELCHTQRLRLLLIKTIAKPVAIAHDFQFLIRALRAPLLSVYILGGLLALRLLLAYKLRLLPHYGDSRLLGLDGLPGLCLLMVATLVKHFHHLGILLNCVEEAHFLRRYSQIQLLLLELLIPTLLLCR